MVRSEARDWLGYRCEDRKSFVPPRWSSNSSGWAHQLGYLSVCIITQHDGTRAQRDLCRLDVHSIPICHFCRARLRCDLVCVLVSWALCDTWNKNRSVCNGGRRLVRDAFDSGDSSYLAYLTSNSTAHV